MGSDTRRVRGRALSDEGPLGRPVRLRLVAAGSGEVVAESVALPNGHYAVDVPRGVGALVVEVRDEGGDVVARQDVSADDETVTDVQFERGSDTLLAPAPLLTGSAVALGRRVAHLEATGELPEGASTVLHAALGRLAWLGSLVEPAQRAALGDAAAVRVIREALAGWAGELDVTGGSSLPGREVREDAGPVEDVVEGPGDALVSADAVSTLMAAVVVAGRTLEEQAELASGLTAVLSVRPWLDALGASAASGDLPAMNVMLGAAPPGMPLPMPSLGGVLVPGGLLGVPGIPGFPGIPGGLPGGKLKGRGGIKVPPTVSDVVELFRSPVMLPPSAQQRCLITAMVEVAQIRDRAPVYRVHGLDPVAACPGSVLTITGTGFGPGGSVVFPGTAAPVSGPAVVEWIDTRIRVVVPPGAAPGRIELLVLEASLHRCGRFFAVYRSGETLAVFEGGTAAVTSFMLDGSEDPIRVEPGALVSLSCDVTAHPSAVTSMWVTQAGATVSDFGSIPGGGHRQHDFTAPVVTAALECVVHLRVSGPCGADEHLRTITVAARPKLQIAYLEVTQGLQDVGHTVRLVAGRTTGVRAYLTSGLGAFSYTGTPGEVADVTGSLFVERGGVIVATLAPDPPKPPATTLTVTASYVDDDRSKAGRALAFTVPGHLVQGQVTIRVAARVPGLPGFGTELVGTSSSRTVSTETGGALTVMQLRLRDVGSGAAGTEPSELDWQATSVGTRDRFPLADDGLVVRVPVSGDVFVTTNDMLTYDGWEDTLDDLDDFADRADDFTSVFACVTPANTMYGVSEEYPKGLNGLAHEANDRPWPLLNDRRVMLVQRGKPGSFAHEMAHTLGVKHAPCGAVKDPDPRLPGRTEAGVVGWRRSDGLLCPPDWPELMSYCVPAGASYDDRWPSRALWNILLGMLK